MDASNLDAVKTGHTYDNFKEQGMPAEIAVIHAIIYNLEIVHRHNDGKYVKQEELAGLVQKEIRAALLYYLKWAGIVISGISAVAWTVISNWNNAKQFFESLSK